MKKTIAAVLAFLMAAGMMTACRGKDSRSGNGIRSSHPDGSHGVITQPETEEELQSVTSEYIIISGTQTQSTVSPNEIPQGLVEGASAAYGHFAFNIMRQCASEDASGNIIISPASLMFAMQMCSGGAEGNTRDEIQDALFPGSPYDVSMDFVSSLMAELSGEYDGSSMGVYNSAWIDENISDYVNEEYLSGLEDDFGASVNVIPFDSASVGLINDTVSRQTDGMIDQLLDEFAPNEIMLLVNTMCFEGTWLEEFPESCTADGIFVNSSGQEEEVRLMSREERLFIESGIATGFIKYYCGPYVFIAILPNDDSISANEFASSFTLSDYAALVASARSDLDLTVTMPKFTIDNRSLMNDTLASLGINDAFDPEMADLSGIADIPDNNVFISRVIHNTHIEVDEHGTCAAAASSVNLSTRGIQPEHRYVELTRPFMFVIAESGSYAPLFVGTVNSAA